MKYNNYLRRICDEHRCELCIECVTDIEQELIFYTLKSNETNFVFTQIVFLEVFSFFYVSKIFSASIKNILIH